MLQLDQTLNANDRKLDSPEQVIDYNFGNARIPICKKNKSAKDKKVARPASTVITGSSKDYLKIAKF